MVLFGESRTIRQSSPHQISPLYGNITRSVNQVQTLSRLHQLSFWETFLEEAAFERFSKQEGKRRYIYTEKFFYLLLFFISIHKKMLKCIDLFAN